MPIHSQLSRLTVGRANLSESHRNHLSHLFLYQVSYYCTKFALLSAPGLSLSDVLFLYTSLSLTLHDYSPRAPEVHDLVFVLHMGTSKIFAEFVLKTFLQILEVSVIQLNLFLSQPSRYT